MTRIIFVTGGVVSSVGKGVTVASIGRILKSRGVSVFKVYVGEFATSLEMAGFSISILKLDGELKDLLGKSADTPFFEQGQI